jgi:hypothetical protein
LSSPPTPTPESPPKVDVSEIDKTLLEQMNSEYRILQDKLDKIGGFRTTIRGWSVTLVIASIIAAGSSKQVSPYVLSLLFLFIYAFYAMERKQNQFGTIFGARVLNLEKRMREELRGHVQDNPILGFYPGIAHHLHSSLKRKSPGNIAIWVTDPDHFFYIVQWIAVAVAMVVLVKSGPAAKSPEFQNVIQMDIVRPEPLAKELGTAPTQLQKREEQKNVKEKEH